MLAERQRSIIVGVGKIQPLSNFKLPAECDRPLRFPGPMRDPILHYIWTNQQPNHMERRQFLLRSCQACAALAFIPAVTLTGCASFKGLSLAADNGMVQIPLAQLDPSGKTMVKAKGAPEKFIVVKQPDGSYEAIELNCTHKGGPVSEKNGQLVCSLHGSTFDIAGHVVKGPAKTDLKRYGVEVVADVLQVKVA